MCDPLFLKGLLGVNGLAPVSYTHLDVYKRQERLFVLITSQLLIEGQVQFIGAVQLFALDFRHDLCKRLEVLLI